ncbi:tyrosine-type recombinase/integrase [Phytohabitans sp. ZYX-F-186]|uniref:Tyrosine-type recombinase/integrase n=1 Tax=Phytohabitans maris TaxID=3071409 RepID=A0ABU0ZFU5_9ACTN|nr:tyrosine-type recombinase/integrase [Phytohabitans sp. ZYX-F-186]MDQ7905936.1 tyrosine-type recombinase/integrase [Phytohabitans sp. ZYX-F-186]
MTALREAADRYLAVRRGLGYKLTIEGRMLGQFVAFCDALGRDHITVAMAVEWATAPAGADTSWWAARLTVVRQFARFQAAFDERTEIPPTDLLPRTADRIQPYLYSPEQITALLQAARCFANPLRAATTEAFIGLMAATGIRTGEAMGLDRDDVDLGRAVLLIRDSKFGKSRMVPLHTTTVEHLTAYQTRRDRLFPCPSTPAFFVSSYGTRLNHTSASKAFARVVKTAAITVPAQAASPRLYDLRHTFAVTTMAAWYAAGADVAHLLPTLSTYLGHISPATTYWYLHACPQLMTEAARRLEASWQEPK